MHDFGYLSETNGKLGSEEERLFEENVLIDAGIFPSQSQLDYMNNIYELLLSTVKITSSESTKKLSTTTSLPLIWIQTCLDFVSSEEPKEIAAKPSSDINVMNFYETLNLR